MHVQGRVASLEDLLCAFTSRRPRILLHGRMLNPISHPKGVHLNELVVWRGDSPGCSVAGGIIWLRTSGVFLLSGHGAHFRDTTFDGAFPSICPVAALRSFAAQMDVGMLLVMLTQQSLV